MCICAVAVTWSQAQQTYEYLLKEDFHGQPAVAPDLVQVPNNQTLTGEFTIRQVPATTCGQQGNAPGYFFEDDAGLVFNNPAGFIDQSYTIAFNFQIDEFISPPSWVRVMSFTHYDDVGIYIRLSGAPTNGTLNFWPYGDAGTVDFFNTVDFYQLILVRNTAGLIKIYVNGSEFAEYDDSGTQAFVPQDPNNFIIWFRDDPSVLENEASPGFVSDIRIANYSYTLAQVQAEWSRFCSSLLGIDPASGPTESGVYPNPAGDKVFLDLPAAGNPYSVYIYDITGGIVSQMENQTVRVVADVSNLHPGIYLLRLTGNDIQKTYRFIKK